MSLIVDALRKAKGLASRNSSPASPAALASFRFGRPSRAQKTRRAVLFYFLPALIGLAVVGYAGNFYLKRLRRPIATIAVVTPSLPQPEQPATLPPPQAVPDRATDVP